MKRITMLLVSLSMTTMLLGGCGVAKKENNPPVIPGDSVKTGYAVISSAEKSVETAGGGGTAQADSTLVAVTVDKDGKIVKCFIDGVQTKINFDATGKITTGLDTDVKTKQELGTEYGMKKVSGIGKEWSEQVTAFSDYVIGKTVDQIKGIAVNEKGAPTISELSSSVTISIGIYISAIEKAVSYAKEIGAKAGDKIGMGAVTTINKSKNAGEQDGLAQAYSSYAIATFDGGGKITSCLIDGSQTNVNISSKGKITSDIKAIQKTKNELGKDYGMAKVSSIGKEWFEEGSALAKYLVGKTVQEAKGISVNEKGVPQDNELKSSVTISISGYLLALEKAQAKAK